MKKFEDLKKLLAEAEEIQDFNLRYRAGKLAPVEEKKFTKEVNEFWGAILKNTTASS